MSDVDFGCRRSDVRIQSQIKDMRQKFHVERIYMSKKYSKIASRSMKLVKNIHKSHPVVNIVGHSLSE